MDYNDQQTNTHSLHQTCSHHGNMFGEENAYSFGLDDCEVNQIVIKEHVREVTNKIAEMTRKIREKDDTNGTRVRVVTRSKTKAAMLEENVKERQDREAVLSEGISTIKDTPAEEILEEVEEVEDMHDEGRGSDVEAPAVLEETADEIEFGNIVYQITGVAEK